MKKMGKAVKKQVSKHLILNISFLCNNDKIANFHCITATITLTLYNLNNHHIIAHTPHQER